MHISLPSILQWLRAGYPQGVPQHDYIALFGVLQRHLTDDEVVTVGRQIIDTDGDGVISDEEIRTQLGNYLHGRPAEDDVRRVAAHLAGGGWPLAGSPQATDL